MRSPSGWGRTASARQHPDGRVPGRDRGVVESVGAGPVRVGRREREERGSARIPYEPPDLLGRLGTGAGRGRWAGATRTRRIEVLNVIVDGRPGQRPAGAGVTTVVRRSLP